MNKGNVMCIECFVQFFIFFWWNVDIDQFVYFGFFGLVGEIFKVYMVDWIGIIYQDDWCGIIGFVEFSGLGEYVLQCYVGFQCLQCCVLDGCVIGYWVGKGYVQFDYVCFGIWQCIEQGLVVIIVCYYVGDKIWMVISVEFIEMCGEVVGYWLVL